MTSDEVLLIIASSLLVVVLYIFIISTLVRLDKHDEKIKELKKEIEELENE